MSQATASGKRLSTLLGTRLRGHRLDAALVVVALALTVVVVIDRSKVSTGESEERKYQLLDAWRGDALRRVHVKLSPTQEGGSAREVTLTRSDAADDWKLEENGKSVEADEQSIAQYLLNLEFGGYERRVEGMDEQTLGLTSPRALVELSMGELDYTLKVGADAPSPPGAAYASVQGGARGLRDYVVSKEFVDGLALSRGQLRSKNPIPYFVRDLESVSLDGPERRWTLTRGGWGGRTSGAFMLERPDQPKRRASRRALDGWMGSLGRLELTSFVDLPAKPHPGAQRLTMKPLDDAEPAALLELGGPCEQGTLVVRRAPKPLAGCAPSKDVEQVLVSGERLVDRYLIGVARSDVNELELRAGDTRIDVAAKDTGWHMRAPSDGPVQPQAMDTLLEQLLKAEGTLLSPEDASDAAALGLAEPRGSIRLVGVPERGGNPASKPRVETLKVGAVQKGWVHVRRDDDGAVLRLAGSAAEWLLPRPSLLRSNTVYEHSAERIESLRLDCDGKHQELERGKTGNWQLREPKLEVAGDLSLAGQLAGGMAGLEALRWVAERPSEAMGLDEPWCRIEAVVKLPADDGESSRQTLRVRLGRETEGGYFAQHDDDRAVFVAPRTLASAASKWMLDRAALIVAGDALAKVTLEAPGRKPLVVLHQGDGWPVEGAPNDRRGLQVSAALDELFASEALSLGAAKPDDGFEEPRLTVTFALRDGSQRVLRVGRGELLDGGDVYRVRRDDIDATFAVAQSRVRPLLDAL